MKVITDAKCLPQSGEHNSYLMQVVISSFLNDFVASLRTSIPFHRVSIPIFCAAFFFFKSTSYFCSFSLSSESISFVLYTIDLGFSPCRFWSAPAPLKATRLVSLSLLSTPACTCTSFPSTFHFRLFSPCGLLLVTEAVSSRLQHQRQSLLFSPSSYSKYFFYQKSPYLKASCSFSLTPEKQFHFQLWLTAHHTKDWSPRGFSCLVMQRSIPRVRTLLRIRDQEVNIVDFVGRTVSSALVVQKQL